MTSSLRTLAACFGIVALATPVITPAFAQDGSRPPGGFATLEALDAFYARRLDDLETRRIADLADLAGRKAGAEADAAFGELFRRAIAHDRYLAADPAAERCLAAGTSSPEVRNLAVLVSLTARTEQGQFDQALDRLRHFMKNGAHASEPHGKGHGVSLLAVGESFVQHLIRSRRYDLARKVCGLLGSEPEPADVAAHFRTRAIPLAMVGKPAPAIRGMDVEGKPYGLSDLEGKVVLVTFWATWCPPCLAEFPRLNALAEGHHDRGFAILGVNVDAHHEDLRDVKSALPIVRHALIQHGVTWPNLMNDEGKGDLAGLCGIATIPSNLLIGRDGVVLGVEIPDAMLEFAVGEALKRPAR
jgi:thiol-disulfide isomerase/thioredoxin